MDEKILPAYFYQNSLGKEPVRDWLKDLDKEDRLAIGTDIKTVEFGWPIGMPTCKPMGKGLYEVRSSLPSNLYRSDDLLYSWRADGIITWVYQENSENIQARFRNSSQSQITTRDSR